MCGGIHNGVEMHQSCLVKTLHTTYYVAVIAVPKKERVQPVRAMRWVVVDRPTGWPVFLHISWCSETCTSTNVPSMKSYLENGALNGFRVMLGLSNRLAIFHSLTT